MHMNGPQNTLHALALSTSTLVFIVEGVTTHLMTKPAITRLTATALSRLVASAFVVYVF